ncbi:hypothetical protein D3C72_967750 [compost metagenome]
MSEPKINYLGPASEAAITTLQHLGYMYNGGQQWKPPIGTKPDFDLIDTLRAERDALQLRLNAADQRIDELTRPQHDDNQTLIAQHQWFIAGEYDDLVDQASDFQDKAYVLGRARGIVEAAQQPAPIAVAQPVDPERERLTEIVERYPTADPLEYDAAVRKLQQ